MAIVDGKIRCSGCKKLLPLASFPPSAVKIGHGKCSQCISRATIARRADPAERARDNAWSRDYYKRNKAKHLARTKRYYDANPDRFFDLHLRRTYGISFDGYQELLAAQGGKCAICRKQQGAQKKRLAVDHDHATGRVRGLLCHLCNRALGTFGDTIEGVRRALSYLERQQQPSLRVAPAIRINLLQGAN